MENSVHGHFSKECSVNQIDGSHSDIKKKKPAKNYILLSVVFLFHHSSLQPPKVF